MLSITSIKQKALILLNNLFSASAVQSKKPQQKTLLQLDELLHLKSLFPSHQIQNTQITSTNTSHILLKYSPCYWAPTNILYTQAHKLPWALSQILPIIAHILSNLAFHKNTHHTTTIIGP